MDNSNVGQTCPLIDDVLNFFDYIHEIEDKEELQAQAEVFKETMEKIRTSNIKLREFGNKWYNECKEIKIKL